MNEEYDPAEDCEPGEPRHLVTAFMTQEEYEERRKRPGTAGFVHLQAHTKYGDLPYGEEHIPQMIWDAAVRTGLTRSADANAADHQDDDDDYDSDFPDTFDTSQWPFELKQLILEAVRRGWTPPSEHVISQWWERNDAEDFLDEFPELKLPFTEQADANTVARRWLESREEDES